MNNTFNLQRFVLLFKKTVLERPVQMFGVTGLLLAFVLILYAVIKSLAGFGAAQNISFLWGLAGGGCFLASFLFNFFSSNAIGSSYLTLPASHFEKWLCGILIVGFFYPVIFLLFYRLVDGSFVTTFHNSLDATGPFYKQLYESVYILRFDGVFARNVYPIFLFLAGSMLIGSLYFNKVSFVKVAMVICGVCIVCFGLNWLFAKMLFGAISDAVPFNRVTIPVGKDEGLIQLPEKTSKMWNYTLQFIVPGMLWLLTFVRLREKEF